jgi:hypothetical protein
MNYLLLYFYLMTGMVTKNEDGLYDIHSPNTVVIESACEGEVLLWIETGEFAYDDNLCRAGELKD